MKAILCNDCGAVMGRFSNVCRSCSRTNLSYYGSTDDLNAQRRQILDAKKDGMMRLMFAGLLVGLIVIFGVGISEAMHHTKQLSHSQPVQTAASEAKPLN